MDIDRMTIARARLAMQEAARSFLFDPNVTLIDFGWPEREGRLATDTLAIRLHVKTKMSGIALETAVDAGRTKLIPPKIGLFDTDVQQASYRLHWGTCVWRRFVANPRAVRCDPMRGGISISNERHVNYGTLGGRVIDRATGDEMILSNWHVLAGDWAARAGRRICQPGLGDGGTGADAVATLTRHAMPANLDAAVATLGGNRRLVSDQFDLGPVRGADRATLGMEVIKSGRRTAVTRGVVTAIEGVVRVRYDDLDRVIRDVVTIEPRGRFGEVSAPGDSGSWWLDEETMSAVGLHFAGSDQPERALALDMPTVLQALDVDIPAAAETARAGVLPVRRRQPVGI